MVMVTNVLKENKVGGGMVNAGVGHIQFKIDC